MRIGVDIDAVLNYGPQVMLECGTKYCVETGRGKLLDRDAYDLTKVFGWSQKEAGDFWCKYAWKQMWECPAQTYAAEVIDKLRAAGHEIWIITGRSNYDSRVNGMPDGQTWDEVTQAWLEKNQIHYDEFGFDTQDKGGFCRQHEIGVMIEDDVQYLATFDERTKVLIFDYPYNQGVRLPNSERVSSWYDIYQKLMA